MKIKDILEMRDSLLRSFQILEKVKHYLSRGVPGDVVLDLIGEMEVKNTEIGLNPHLNK